MNNRKTKEKWKRPLFFSFILLAPFSAHATEWPELVPQQASIQENLNSVIDLELKFVDQHQKTFSLGDAFLKNRPVIVTPVYYRCPRLCSLTLNGLVQTLKSLDLKLGSDFSIATVSFNHQETPELAKTKAENYYKSLGASASEKHAWHFLVGEEQNVQQLMQSLGFGFTPDGQEFSHAAALMILTPTGKIARYFYGIEYQPNDMRLALVEAAQGKIGSTIDKFLLYCFRFDPTRGKYTPVIMNIVRVISLGIFGLLVFVLLLLKLKEKRDMSDV